MAEYKKYYIQIFFPEHDIRDKRHKDSEFYFKNHKGERVVVKARNKNEAERKSFKMLATISCCFSVVEVNI